MVPGAKEDSTCHFHSLPLATRGHMATYDLKETEKCNFIKCFDGEEQGYLWRGLKLADGASSELRTWRNS